MGSKPRISRGKLHTASAGAAIDALLQSLCLPLVDGAQLQRGEHLVEGQLGAVVAERGRAGALQLEPGKGLGLGVGLGLGLG